MRLLTFQHKILQIGRKCRSVRRLSTCPGDMTESPKDFAPKNVLIMTKLTRLEFEKLRHGNVSDEELEQTLRQRGSDYSSLLYHHYIHKGGENRIEKCLKDFGVETKVVNRLQYTDEDARWADLIVTAGGDGTFLMAAGRVLNRNKPVVGFNTDPTRSEGYLCLPKSCSLNVKGAVKSIFEGKFKWTFRRRIRTTLIGEHVFDKPVELHDQKLQHPEFRFFDCLQDHHVSQLHNSASSSKKQRTLPFLALNEVYMGETVSARVSNFEVMMNEERIKSKNAGICVSTGTGSTSWSYNISKITSQEVADLFKVLVEEGIQIDPENRHLVRKIVSKYNEKLIFHPETPQMMYNIRDPISSYSLPLAYELPNRGLVDRLEIRSRCFDACLVIDGGLSFNFNDGTVAIFETHDSDALRTIIDVSL